jgi:hypothetical protein
MKHNRLFSALAKVGATINPIGLFSYTATKEGGCTVNWTTSTDGTVSHVTKRHPDTDAMYDNFYDSYFDTIKGAVQAICEQPYKSYKNG